MKILLEDLISGRYYKCYKSKQIWYIFRYHSTDENFICSYGYQISYNNLFEEFINIENCYCDDVWFNTCIVEEVFFDDINKYYPSNHPEIIEYRKRKINSLLILSN